jgi:hypothetical protein
MLPCYLNSKLVVYFMYHILNFYIIIFSILLSRKMNFKMIKCGMVVLTGRQKAEVIDADVTMN